MSNSISGINPAIAIAPIASPGAASAAGGGFASVLADAVNCVEQYRVGADDSIQKFLSGEESEIHKVALATQQAQLSFELFVQAKNKVVQAYQEIMRMQL